MIIFIFVSFSLKKNEKRRKKTINPETYSFRDLFCLPQHIDKFQKKKSRSENAPGFLYLDSNKIKG